MSSEAGNGMLRLKSSYSVSETVERIESALKLRGIRLFCRIDHAAAAAEAGLRITKQDARSRAFSRANRSGMRKISISSVPEITKFVSSSQLLLWSAV